MLQRDHKVPQDIIVSSSDSVCVCVVGRPDPIDESGANAAQPGYAQRQHAGAGIGIASP